MAMTINTNVLSLNAQRNLGSSQSALSTAMQRLSSGLRVNSAKDDAAGLAISERMQAQVRGMNVAARNANDGISLAQTAEGALSKIGDNLQRMRELAVQAANGTNSASDLTALNQEFADLTAENTRVTNVTKFNETALLSAALDMKIQVGANKGDAASGDVIGIKTATALTLTASLDLTTDAAAAIKGMDDDIATVTKLRSTFGALQNRFEAVVSNLQISSENLSSARSRIVDADFASETANLSRAQILQQAGTAMLSQANQSPQQVLSLLR
jgi:flagellin